MSTAAVAAAEVPAAAPVAKKGGAIKMLLAEINKMLDEQKKPHVNGVVFTNFVMQ